MKTGRSMLPLLPRGSPKSDACAASMPVPTSAISAWGNFWPTPRRAKTAHGPVSLFARRWKKLPLRTSEGDLFVGVRNARGAHWRGEGGAQERELAAKYRAWAERLHFEYPYVGGVLEEIAASYDREAGWQDTDAKVAKRLRY